MTNKEQIIKMLQEDDIINATHFLLSKIVQNDIFPELVDRYGISGIESRKFSEYLEKESI